MEEEGKEKKVNFKKILLLKLLIILLIMILAIVIIGIGAFYVINKDTFDDAAVATKTYTGNATMDPEKGILVQQENDDGTTSEVSVEEILKEIDGAGTYLKDDEESTKEEKLQYLMNAELVTKFPYISSLEGDESKLNGVLKFYRFTTQLEAEDGQTESEDAETNIEIDPTKIFYIGDSWMEGLESYIPKNEYPGEDHFIFKRGANSKDSIFLDDNLKEKIDKVKTDVSSIVIMLGLNNPNDSTANRMNEIVNFLSTTYADKTIYVLKVPHVAKTYGKDISDAIELNNKIDKYNQIILENCSDKTNVKFIDVTNNLMTDDLYYLDPEFADGAYHLNAKGKGIWYNNIKECIAKGKSSADTEKYQMTYLKEEDFNNMVDKCKASGNKEVFKYFTINDENEIVVATWRSTSKTVTTDDPEITADTLNETSTYNFSKTEDGVFSGGKYTITTTSLIKYDTLAEKYALPFNLLWAFLVETKDYKLTAEIANLAYESDIRIGIYDNQTTSIQNNTETYNKSIRYTENTDLIFPKEGETTPSFNINNSKYDNVVRSCRGKILNNKQIHNDDFKNNDPSLDMLYGAIAKPALPNRNDGNLYTYYVSAMDKNGTITGLTSNQDEAGKFTITTHTSTTSASSPSIGIFYVDNWIATWKTSYQLTAQESTSNASSGTNEDNGYESISENRISESVVADNLSKHSEKIKQEAIEEIKRNTTISVPATEITTEIIQAHIESCATYCQPKLEEVYGKTYEQIKKDKQLQLISIHILRDKDYTGEDNNSLIRKQIYQHVNTAQQIKQKQEERKQKETFENQLNSLIKYNQWPTAEEENVNIEFKSSSTRNPYAYEKDTSASTIENEGIKFKEIINKEEYYEDKQAILNRTEWFWEYIRSAENTAKLEDVIRLIFNIAFDTNQFGTFDQDDIERIFRVFEPKLRKIGMTHKQAILEWIKSYENNALRKYINGDGISYESVKNYVTEDMEFGKMYYTEFDECWNFTYGIMVCNSAGALNNQGIFEEYGYDLDSMVKDAKAGKTVTVPMEDLDQIYEELVQRNYQALKEVLKEHEAEMETWQINSLVNFCYQWGNCGQYLKGENNIAEVYKKYYVEQNNPEEFKNNAVLLSGSGDLVKFFLNQYKLRQENAWIMFSEGRYILSDGEELFVYGGSGELILETCAIVTQELLDNDVVYSVSNLAWNDIKRSTDFSSGIGCCCATYVAAVIYKAELLPEDFINKYNYNLAGSETYQAGFYTFLKDAGWEIVDEEDAQPGDVCTWNQNVNGERNGHVFIYAGGDLIWDQTSGVRGDGYSATGGPVNRWNSWKEQFDIVVFRAP